ncbi:MAG: hypothetical protein ACRDHX_06025, partial [Chloroflexota bacterium]
MGAASRSSHPAGTAATPRISVLIPAMGAAGAIQETLRSVQGPDADGEVLVMGPAAAHGRAGLLEANPNIRVLAPGRSRTRWDIIQRLLSASHGRFISIISPGDRVTAEHFQRNLALLEAHEELAFSYSRADEHTSAAPQAGHGYLDHGYAGGRDECFELLFGNWMPTAAVIYRREALEAAVIALDTTAAGWLNDWEVHLRCALEAETAYVPLRLVLPGEPAAEDALPPATKAEGYLRTLRRLLLEDSSAPLLEAYRWQELRGAFEQRARGWFANEPETLPGWLSSFEELRRDCAIRNSRQGTRLVELQPTTDRVR